MLLFSTFILLTIASEVEFKIKNINFESNIYIWNLTSRQLGFILNSSNGKVNSLQKLSNNLLASGYDNGFVRIWNLTNHKVNYTFFHLNAGNLLRLSRIESNEKLLAVSTVYSVTIWNILTGQKEFILQENSFFPISLVDLFNGLFAISYASHLNLFQLIVYDLKNDGKIKYVLSNSSNEIGPCVRLYNSYLACGILTQDKSSNRVNVWNLASGQLEFSVMNCSIYSSSLMKNEKMNYYLVTQSTIDFKIYVWNLSSKELEFYLAGHTDLIIYYEKLSNDSTNMLATKSLDNTTRIWKKDRTLAFIFESEWPNNYMDLIYLPGKSLCSLENNLLGEASGKDSNIKIWNVTSGQLEFTLNKSNNDGSYVFEMVKLEKDLMASLFVNF